jgi:hypothetical protein
MTKAEQEMVIRWDRDEQVVQIWTADPTVWRKLDRLGVAVKEETYHKGEVTGRFYVPIPLAMFRFGVKRERTAAQKAAAAKARASRQQPLNLQGADGANAVS